MFWLMIGSLIIVGGLGYLGLRLENKRLAEESEPFIVTDEDLP